MNPLIVTLGLLVSGGVALANETAGIMTLVAMYGTGFNTDLFYINALAGLMVALMLNARGKKSND